MKSQQIAVYASLNEFMVAVGYQNASDAREDDPVWSTLNDNNFKAMMEYKFGVESRLIAVPTKLEAVHEGITSHEAWSYREDLEHDDGEETPVELEAVATPPEGGEPGDTVIDTNAGTGDDAGGPEDDKVAEEGGDSQEEPPSDVPADGGGEEPTDDESATEGDAAKEGGDSVQE